MNLLSVHCLLQQFRRETGNLQYLYQIIFNFATSPFLYSTLFHCLQTTLLDSQISDVYD